MTAAGLPQVAILADDLIWATRLTNAVRDLGGTPRQARRLADLASLLAEGVTFAIVDLTARAYDGLEGVRLAAATGARVLAVGQHDDLALRRSALAAGAERVCAYRKLFDAGPATLGSWLRSRRAAPAAAAVET